MGKPRQTQIKNYFASLKNTNSKFSCGVKESFEKTSLCSAIRKPTTPPQNLFKNELLLSKPGHLAAETGKRNRSGAKRPVLPKKFEALLQLYRIVESSLALHFSRNKAFASLDELAASARITAKRELGEADLCRMAGVVPEALEVKKMVAKGLHSLCKLVVVLIHRFESDSPVAPNQKYFFMSERVRKFRVSVFERRLLDIVETRHSAFLRKNRLKLDHRKYGEWHIDFPLESVPLPTPFVPPEPKTAEPAERVVLKGLNAKSVSLLASAKLRADLALKTAATFGRGEHGESKLPGISTKLVERIRKRSALCSLINSHQPQRQALRRLEQCKALVLVLNLLFITAKRTKMPLALLAKELLQRGGASEGLRLAGEAEALERIGEIEALAGGWVKKVGRSANVLELRKNVSFQHALRAINAKMAEINKLL